MKVTTPARNMHRPVRTSCPRCGKRCYASRKIAKQQAKVLFPGQHMGVYDCDWYNVKWFHLTSEPQRKKEARREVSERSKRELDPLVVQVLDEMYEKAEAKGEIPWNDAQPLKVVVVDGFETLEAMIDTALTDEEKARGLEETFGDE